MRIALFFLVLPPAVWAQPPSIVVGQPIAHRIDHMLSGSRSNIAVKIFGPDLAELRRLTQEVKAQVEKIPGAVDVTDEQQTNIPFLTVRFKRPALAHTASA